MRRKLIAPKAEAPGYGQTAANDCSATRTGRSSDYVSSSSVTRCWPTA